MRVLLLLVAIAGCSFDPRANPATDAGGDVGEDAADAPPPNLDLDDDGVPNGDDNCVDIANPDQFNEDGDATGDVCDRCPHLGEAAADMDRDADGIGDGCDPRPDAAGDQLVFWNGFHVAQAGLPTGFAMVHGNGPQWSVADGALVFARTGDDWSIPAFDTGSRQHTIDTTFQITTSFPVGLGSASAAGVTVDVDGGDNDLFECQARTDNQERELWYWDGGVFGGWTELDSAATPTTNDVYRIVLQRTATDLACSTTRAGATTALTNTSDSLNNTRAGLFARNVDASFRYVAIYTSP